MLEVLYLKNSKTTNNFVHFVVISPQASSTSNDLRSRFSACIELMGLLMNVTSCDVIVAIANSPGTTDGGIDTTLPLFLYISCIYLLLNKLSEDTIYFDRFN